MPVTLRDIAEACGVDVSTVSRALRDDPRVKAETAERVKKAAAGMEYRPNLAARSLAAGRSNTVWFVLNSISNPIEREPAESVSRFLAEHRYDLFTALYRGDADVFARLVGRLRQGVTDGAFFIPHGWEDPALLRPLAQKGYPLVCIDRAIDGVDIPTVTTDNGVSARQLVASCYEVGCRAFALLFGTGNSSARSRHGAAVDEIEKRGCVWTAGDDVPGGKAMVAVLGSQQSNLLRFAETHSLQKRGLAFGCFDAWIGDSWPAERAFTAVQDFNGIAREAAGLMMQLVKGGTRPGNAVIRVPALEYLEVGRR